MKLYSYWRSLATFRVRIALNLKGLTPDLVTVDLQRGDQREAEYRKINPEMVIPTLIADDGAVVFQSLAIVEYLDETHPNPPLLPSDPAGRARVRGLAQIVACDAHPLVVPRVRNYLEREFAIPEPQRMAWCRHWIAEALGALESHLAKEPQTGRFCHGDRFSLADICLVSHAVGAKFFGAEIAPFPTAARIVEACLAIDAVARAHPLRQPGAPASV
jgi:maleylacetoacetate isomerase/maleylpyruvate isomerase